MIRDLPMWAKSCWLKYVPCRYECEGCEKTFVERVAWKATELNYTAALLTTADLIGVGMCLVADSLMHSTLRGEYSDFINSVSIWLVAFVIFSNALGAVLYPMLSPHAERARKEKETDAEFSLKKREAEHELSLAQLELQNARMRADARNLLMEATQTGAGNWPTRSAAPWPATSMAKDAPTMPNLADEYSGKSADELREMLRSLKGQSDPK